MLIFNESANTNNIIFDFNINLSLNNSECVDIKFSSNSFMILNENLKININKNNILISDYYSSFFNLNNKNLLNISLVNFELDINPPLIIPNYFLNLEFDIIKFPIYINIYYLSEFDKESLVISKSNINL